jgi:hypothetical protein
MCQPMSRLVYAHDATVPTDVLMGCEPGCESAMATR